MTGPVSPSKHGIDAVAFTVEPPVSAATSPGAGRARDSRRRQSRSRFALGLAVVVALYVVGYGVLLAATHGLPYVTDNNESFGAYFHGSSLIKFGVGESFGLTDEAFSPEPSAHPFVYTHGGNFPRVYTALLFALGAQSVRAQIIIATFTVGLAGLVLLYVFFSSVAGTLFATVACLVFGSDYVFFTQWQANSYRVWHTFLLFAALTCTLAWFARRPRLQLALAFVCELCLVYFDLTFAVFASILVGLYIACLNWRRPLSVIGFWFAQAAGGIACVVLMVAQNVAYMGWPAFQFDLSETYGARNTALAGTPAGDQLLAALHSFYATHHIAFWRQLGAGGADRDLLSLFAQLIEFTLLPMTPLFSLVVLVLFAGWGLSLVHVRTGERLRYRTPATIILALATFAASFAILDGQAVLGPAPQASDLAHGIAAGVLAACVAIGTILGLVSGAFGAVDIPTRRVWLASGLLVAAAVWVRAQPALYDSDLSSLWLLSAWLPTWLAQTVALLAIGFAVYVVLHSERSEPGEFLLLYLGCGLAAYAGVRTLLPGYVLSDYLERSAPLPVYVRDAAVALVFTLLIHVLVRQVRVGRRLGAVSPNRLRAWGSMLVVGGLAVFLAAFWANLQRQYGVLIPADHAGFLELLGQPPFRGATFVASQYAAPVAAQTGQWAYLDPLVGSGMAKFTEDGFIVSHDDWYTWFADASTNDDYSKPQYFLCFVPLSLRSAANRLSWGVASVGSGCSGWQIVRRASSTEQLEFPRDRLVLADPTGLDDWAIVQLDWDYPPYLRSIPDTTSNAQVLVSVESTPSGFAVRPEYDARIQGGALLLPAELRLYADEPRRCLLVDTTDPADLRLPPAFSGPVRVSVTPRTATTTGSEYLSKQAWVGLRLFKLPNVVTGGVQEIAANSLEEAEQMAQAAGTWDNSAGTFGLGFQPVPGPDPCAGR